MKTKILLITFTVIIYSIFIHGKLYSQHKISAWVTGGGGGISSNDQYRVISTLGQPSMGLQQNESFMLQSGFWYAASISIVTSVHQREDFLPHHFHLEQNFPNPFNPITQIQFSIREENDVTLTIYDILGRMVTVLMNDVLQPGQYTVSFEAGKLPSGVYIYRLQSGLQVSQKRMVLLK